MNERGTSAEEIDGLRHELAECQRCNERLRAENAELTEVTQLVAIRLHRSYNHDVWAKVDAILAKTKKEEE